MRSYSNRSYHRSSSHTAALLFLLLVVAAPASNAQDTTWVPPVGGQQVQVGDSTMPFNAAAPPTAQDVAFLPDSVFRVDSIIVSGNEKTQTFVIVRELSLKPGVHITGAAIKYDQQRVYGLGLFNEVRMWVSPTGTEKANVYIHVVERWYLIPYPIFGMKEGKWSKSYFGAGLIHTNFRGRNEKLYVSFALGYDPFGSIAYRNPFLDDEGSEFIETRVSYSKVRNRSALALAQPGDVFDEQHLSFGATFGKRYGNEHTAWVSGEFHMVTVNDYLPVPTISPSGTDRYPVLSAGYTYDSRDLYEYASRGTMIAVAAVKYGAPGSDIDYVRYALDAREYVPILPELTVAARGSTNLLAGGTAPSYNRVYLGYQYRVRGYYRDVIEGENIAGASAELRYALVPAFYYRSKLLPSQFGVWKFSVHLAVFADMGTVWFRGQSPSYAKSLRGYGGGLHLGFPYGFVVRTEYAVNDRSEGEFIFDIGAAF